MFEPYCKMNNNTYVLTKSPSNWNWSSGCFLLERSDDPTGLQLFCHTVQKPAAAPESQHESHVSRYPTGALLATPLGLDLQTTASGKENFLKILNKLLTAIHTGGNSVISIKTQ